MKTTVEKSVWTHEQFFRSKTPEELAQYVSDELWKKVPTPGFDQSEFEKKYVSPLPFSQRMIYDKEFWRCGYMKLLNDYYKDEVKHLVETHSLISLLLIDQKELTFLNSLFGVKGNTEFQVKLVNSLQARKASTERRIQKTLQEPFWEKYHFEKPSVPNLDFLSMDELYRQTKRGRAD